MDILDRLYLTDVLHSVSSAMLVPVVVLLFALLAYTLYTVGSLVVEALFERRRFRAYVPQLLAALNDAAPADLPRVIDESGLLRGQKDDLEECAAYLWLPEDARTEVARRLLANEDLGYKKAVDRCDLVAKVAPMLGLMGTLIPLGPGIVALSSGDTQTLSDSLLMAFDTTVAGLAAAAVCFVGSRVRSRWYADYLVSTEACLNALLEKAARVEAAGGSWERAAFAYDGRGRTARRVAAERGVAGDAAAEGAAAPEGAC